MPVQTSCPACSQQVRVPDQLLGRNVKCPKCGHVFLAGGTGGYAPPPTHQEAAPPPPPPPQYQDHPSEQYDDQQPEYDDHGEERPRRRRRRRSRGADVGGKLTAPAICLLITGILWLLYAVVNTGFVVAQGGFDAAMKENPLMKGGGKDPAEKTGMVVGFYGALILGPILGILVTAGGACMLGRKLRGLAMAGSIAAMIPCSPCCLLGLPFGIWSLVVLANQDVKDAFT